MSQLFIGVVERVAGVPSPGPGARLRPVYESSPDKSRWVPVQEERLSEDFPNTGVVSWWQPLPDATLHSTWVFQTDQSGTYDENKPQHDLYRVKGSPSMPIELVDIDAEDPEEVRQHLLDHGLPTASHTSRRIVFRDRSGTLIGPVELVLSDDRLLLDEKHLKVPLTLSQARPGMSVAEWQNHRFLPPDGWSSRTGEVDYSANDVFLKRVLRDLRKMEPSVLEDVPLTEKLISRYCAAVSRSTLTPLQRQRVVRLQKIGRQAMQDVAVPEEALSDFLALPPVAAQIEGVKTKAAEDAAQAMRSSLKELEMQRSAVEQETQTLRREADERRRDLTDLETRHQAALDAFDENIKHRFEEAANNASSFLADVPLLRAALGVSIPSHGLQPATSASTGHVEAKDVPRSELMVTVRREFNRLGIGCSTCNALLASLASGFVPMLFGPRAHDSLAALSTVFVGRRLYWLTFSPILSSPTDLLKSGVTPESEIGSALTDLEGLLENVRQSDALSLIVFDNVNLAQIDSALVPVVRRYAELRSSGRADSAAGMPRRYTTPVGEWPSNLLIAGVMIDSPLALPLSTELWSFATFIDTTLRGRCGPNQPSSDSMVPSDSKVPYREWAGWLAEATTTPDNDCLLVARYVDTKLRLGGTLNRLLRNLAAAANAILPNEKSERRLELFVESSLVPYCVSRRVDLRAVLEGCPVEFRPRDMEADRLTSLFIKLGIEPQGAGKLESTDYD